MNGLRSRSHLMVDKITTISKLKIGYRVSRLDDGDLPRLNWHLKVFLGLSD
jgi:mRNA interferase MazF